MSTVAETIAANAPLWLAAGGFLVGCVFGAVTYRTNFCTMGALSDAMNLADRRRLRAWMLAIAVSIAGAQTLDAIGVVQLSKSMYLTPTVNWLGNILGGLLFGYGMVFSGGCVSRNLVRAGSGDLRALISLAVLGVFAYMTIGGVLGMARASVEQATQFPLAPIKASTQGMGDILAAFVGKAPDGMNRLVGYVIAGALALYAFADAEFRASTMNIAGGLGVGLSAVAGWAVTGLAYDELSASPVAPISLTYVRPAGDTLEWLMRATGLGLPSFGVMSVFGALTGAFLVSQAMGRFRLTTFSDLADTQRNLFGAALMGIGGVLAMGCTMGQAITGISTVAVGSALTIAGIVAGGVLGLKRFEKLVMAEA